MQARKDTSFKNAKIRGMTLTELTVVLAVLAIVAALVSTYIVMLTQRLRTATATLNAMQDISVVTSITENFIDAVAKDEKTLGNPIDDGSALCNTEGEVTYSLSFSGGTITAVYPNLDENITFHSDVIENISFYTDDGDLFFVTVTYKIPTSKTEFRTETFTFTVNSYVGEISSPSPAGSEAS